MASFYKDTDFSFVSKVFITLETRRHNIAFIHIFFYNLLRYFLKSSQLLKQGKKLSIGWEYKYRQDYYPAYWVSLLSGSYYLFVFIYCVRFCNVTSERLCDIYNGRPIRVTYLHNFLLFFFLVFPLALQIC